MSRRCLVLGFALLLPSVWAQAETNRYQAIAAQRQAGAAPASYVESRAMPAELPTSLTANANPIQQVGFHHGYGGYGYGGYGGYGGGYGGGCASCGGGGTGFTGECCDSMPSCARGIWDSYCYDKACWHGRMHGCGGHGCGRGCGGGCFLSARGAPPMVACGGCCGTFGRGHCHGRFRGASISDCGCAAEPGCGCAAGGAAPAAGLAPLPSPALPGPEAAAFRGTFGPWAANRFPQAMSSPSRVGFTR